MIIMSAKTNTSAWSKDWSKAPKDRMIMARHRWSETPCPVFIHWEVIPDGSGEPWQGWIFDEELISNVEGSLITTDYEWAEVPK